MRTVPDATTGVPRVPGADGGISMPMGGGQAVPAKPGAQNPDATNPLPSSSPAPTGPVPSPLPVRQIPFPRVP
jgi:hypothetical protein